MKAVHFRVMNALTPESEGMIISYEANPVFELMQQLRQTEVHSNILLLLDNVDQFAEGDDDAAMTLNASFMTFLQRLLGRKDYQGMSKLKILLTSRTTLRQAKLVRVDNYEVKALEMASSSALLQTQGIGIVQEGRLERLLQMCQGNPLIINGIAAILRQHIADDKNILETIEQELVAGPRKTGVPPTENSKESNEREEFEFEKEGVDKEQENCLRKMFFFLPSKRLKESAISMSLFSRSFSFEAAAFILGVDSSEAIIQLEGLRNSNILSIDPEADVLSYDIHPLMRNFLKSLGNSKVFIKVYQKAMDRFCDFFMSKIKDISELLDKHYIEAFDKFDFDKPNFELALEISFKSDYHLIPMEHHESVMKCYLFEAMLDEIQRRKIFNCWAEKVEEDGKKGSLLRAELKCREALQVLNLEGWQRALEVVKRAGESLNAVQKECTRTDLFRFTRSSYLYVEGEVYYRAGNMTKALRILHRALKIMEDILQSHTSTTRCLNAIGNCHNRLGNHDEAINYYTRAYEMREQLSGSMNHFDIPFFKCQIGTVYEGRRQYQQAIDYYKEALYLAKKLKISEMINISLYNRNIANAYCWMRKFEEAYQPAKNGYEIRMVILGNHPWTARSAFQVAEICRGLEDFEQAKEFYDEAWKIEKSLGHGNHSEVMVRIVESYECMLLEVRKEQFQKEAVEFYLRYWDEEREFVGFEFSLANKKVIDSIMARLNEFGERQTRTKYEREALWFYEGVWNSPDTRKLPEKEREGILQTLLELCDMLHENDVAKRYESEAFRFYERKWKRDKAKMERPDRIDILTRLQELASSLANEKKRQKYQTLLKEAKKSGTLMGTVRSYFLSGSAAEQLSSDDDDDDDLSPDNDDENTDDSSNGSEEIAEDIEQLEQLAIHEKEVEEVESQKEREYSFPGMIKIHECLVDESGAVWKPQELQVAACITFPPNAVSKPVLFRCTLWESTMEFPPLLKDEELVSDVVQLSYDDPYSCSFTGNFDEKVSVALSHSAVNLRGYEVTIRELVDLDNNEWRDLETTNVWQISAVQRDLVSKPRVPYAEAKVTCCSTYGVICRLKSYTFSIRALCNGEFTCRIPAYPDVSVTIPAENVIHARRDLQLILKVQEIPQQWFDDNEMLAGPTLHIMCPDAIQLLMPATITLPMSLDADENQFAEFSSSNVVVLVSYDDSTSNWQEITTKLPRPVEFVNGVVTFQVTHFSRYWILQKKKNFAKWKLRQASRLPGSTPMEAGFFACLCSTGNVSCENSQLRFCCYPVHLEERVRETICSTYNVLRYGSGDSIEPLCKDDLINVAPCRGLKARDGTSEDVLMLKFRPKKKFERDVIVRDSRNIIPQIKFFRHVDRKTLCELSIVPPLQDLEKQHVVFSGAIDVPESSTGKRMSLSHDGPVPKRPKVTEDGVKEGWPTLEELLDLSQKLDKWKPLGRHLLDMDESIIAQIHMENEELEEKAYQMLRHWKQKKHSAATYHALYTALCRVNRKDLAEKFCCAHSQVPHKIY